MRPAHNRRKAAQRRQLAWDVTRYCAGGGVVHQVPSGISGDKRNPGGRTRADLGGKHPWHLEQVTR